VLTAAFGVDRWGVRPGRTHLFRPADRLRAWHRKLARPPGAVIARGAMHLRTSSDRRSGMLDQGRGPGVPLSDVVDAELTESPLGMLIAGWHHSHDRETRRTQPHDGVPIEPAHPRGDQRDLGLPRGCDGEQVPGVIASLHDDGSHRAVLARLNQRRLPLDADARRHDPGLHGEPSGRSGLGDPAGASSGPARCVVERLGSAGALTTNTRPPAIAAATEVVRSAGSRTWTPPSR